MISCVLDFIPKLIPSIMAIIIVSIVVLVSKDMKSRQRLNFQSRCFVTFLCLGLAYLSTKESEVIMLWNTFAGLADDVKFFVSFVIFTMTYFLGSFYLGPVDNSDAKNNSPALCDSSSIYSIPTSLPDLDVDVFNLTYNTIVKEIVADLTPIYELPTEAVNWVEKMVNYTVAGGKMTRGLTVMNVQQLLAASEGRPLSNKERVRSAALGWGIEFLQAFFLVADDAMDDSVLRRGHPCWYRLPEVKLIAINDSFILESCVYKIIKRYFGDELYYSQLVDLFIEVTRQTEFGQLLDLTSQPLGGKIDLDRFTMERYSSIVKYKTAFYTFYLPVASAMICSGVTDKEHYEQAKKILLMIGEYFQIQDDYLDCYGKPEDIGKVGTDIQDNKCSWLVVKALEIVNPTQRKILNDNYGVHDEKKINIVKKLYTDLNIESIFKEYEENIFVQITKSINEIESVPRECFNFLLKKTFKRSK